MQKKVGVGAGRISSLAGWLYFSMLAGFLLVGGNLIHVIVHEILGHGLVTLLVGQQVTRIYISPFSGYVDFTESQSPALLAAQQLGGSFVGILAGGLLLFWVYPRSRGRPFHVRLFILLTAVAFATELTYDCISPIMAFGDTFNVEGTLGIMPGYIVVAFILPIVVAFYVLSRRLLELCAPYFRPAATFMSRLGLLLKITITPGFFMMVYGALWGAFFFGVQYTLFNVLGTMVTFAVVLPSVLLAAIRPHMAPEGSGQGDIRAELGAMARWAGIIAIVTMVITLVFVFLQVPGSPLVT